MNGLSKDSVNYLTVDEEFAGQRLDNYLIRLLKGVPKSHVYRIVRSGEVRVNKGRVDVTYRLQPGDVVRVPPVRTASVPVTHAPQAGRGPTIPVLFEDDYFIAVNKPAGMAVHGGSGVSYGVIEQLRVDRPQAKFLELVHRLDRETSGILLVAKKRAALLGFHDLFRDHSAIDKRYYALVKGRVANDRQHVRLKLLKFTGPDGERRVRVSDDGVDCHTIFNVARRFSEATLVEAELKTGRTHQIRVHLQSGGHPILGDDRYGDFALNKRLASEGLKRMFLHAFRLQFPHPVTQTPVCIEAPLPDDLSRYLEKLGAQDAKSV